MSAPRKPAPSTWRDPYPQHATTKAGDWFAARLRGERLPQHKLEGER